jgi:hypothetical protein
MDGLPANPVTRCRARRVRREERMAEDFPINRALVRDLVCRLEDPDEHIQKTAAEALAVMASDEGWSPDELIFQGGIEALADLLDEGNTPTLIPALDIIIAIAASGRSEELITSGIIAGLDRIREHDDYRVRDKVQDALWLIEPEIEDVVTSKPEDEY